MSLSGGKTAAVRSLLVEFKVEGELSHWPNRKHGSVASNEELTRGGVSETISYCKGNVANGSGEDDTLDRGEPFVLDTTTGAGLGTGVFGKCGQSSSMCRKWSEVICDHKGDKDLKKRNLQCDRDGTSEQLVAAAHCADSEEFAPADLSAPLRWIGQLKEWGKKMCGVEQRRTYQLEKDNQSACKLMVNPYRQNSDARKEHGGPENHVLDHVTMEVNLNSNCQRWAMANFGKRGDIVGVKRGYPLEFKLKVHDRKGIDNVVLDIGGDDDEQR
ncbi:hypothetical protein JAAARDRAFT_49954 [Jaapia argillacea MUCL 33604]|uniref:Uncharacterized protein n=1 Tax=Jaapia argillacea MUCL 33604 TaxID=933084 RepID=A0A067PSF5_9AGAM|nr:hypothetical protein JAAARDRAFT_49954 [Jaapia argillacea MUCL 33604]